MKYPLIAEHSGAIRLSGMEGGTIDFSDCYFYYHHQIGPPPVFIDISECRGVTVTGLRLLAWPPAGEQKEEN